MEITVLSAEGLKSICSGPFSHRLRPFITITTYPPIPCQKTDKNNCQSYTTRIDDHGGVNPTWGDKFHVPIDTASFLSNRYSCIFIELFTKRLIKGKVLLGWCQIPVTDIGFSPDNSVRHLSYRIRAKDGTKGQGVVNLAIKLSTSSTTTTAFQQVTNGQTLSNGAREEHHHHHHHHQIGSEDCQTVIGIPVVNAFSDLNLCQ